VSRAPVLEVTSPSAFARAALDAEADRVARATPGTRNDVLNQAAYRVGQLLQAGGLERSEAEARLAAAANTCGLPDDETRSTIHSGLEAGLAQPRLLQPSPTPSPGGPSMSRPRKPRAASGAASPSPIPATEPDDPHRLARIFLDQACSHPDGPTLRFHGGTWHRWSGAAYRPMIEADLDAELARVLQEEADRLRTPAARNGRPYAAGNGTRRLRITRGLIADVKLALQGLTRIDPATQPPAWLTEKPPFPAAEVLAARNGLLHIPGWCSERGESLIPATPGYFCCHALDYEFDPEATRPGRWLDFLAELWPGDPESIETLQEWFGYLLTQDTSLHKILLIVGPPRAGKGVITRVLERLVGPANVAHPGLQDLASPFGLAPLLGKSVAIVHETRLGRPFDAARAIQRLASISGQDSQTVDRKYQPQLTARLSTRFVMTTNQLPRLPDNAGALASRLVVLRLTESFLGREDAQLTGKLLRELPGILLWALEGWCRLQERGAFLQPESGIELREQFARLSSPILQFVEERCVVRPGRPIDSGSLFAEWRDWCAAGGIEDVGTVQDLGTNLRAALPQIESKRGRRRSGPGHCTYYLGIGLAGASQARQAGGLLTNREGEYFKARNGAQQTHANQ
jgi:putative DNA primase/helicase